MIWDILLTLFSLAVFAWYVIILPAMRWLRPPPPPPPPLPPPRFRPVEEKKTDDIPGDSLLQVLMGKYGAPEPVPGGTGTDRDGGGPGGTDDTEAENHRYQQILSLVKKGYSGNQIVTLVGGSRATILALVKRAREETK